MDTFFSLVVLCLLVIAVAQILMPFFVISINNKAKLALEGQRDVLRELERLNTAIRAASTPPLATSARLNVAQAQPAGDGSPQEHAIEPEQVVSGGRAGLVRGREYNNYRGWEIRAVRAGPGRRYHVDVAEFSSLEEAADHIDKMHGVKKV